MAKKTAFGFAPIGVFRFNLCFLFLLLLVPGGLYSAESGKSAVVGTITLKAKIRDFKEYNTQGGHPDFERVRSCTGRGAVSKKIDTTGQGSSFPGDHRNPKLVNVTNCFTSVDRFDEWYNDRDTNVNRAFLVDLVFQVTDGCLLKYISSSFFPIDNGRSFTPVSDPPVQPFGHLQTSNTSHNYGFTMEFHARFTYFKGAGQIFSFLGDDDVWVFINDSLVIDLGGVHVAQSASVILDQLPPGFMVDGQSYPLDFFSAERHTVQSNIQITTSMFLEPEQPILLIKRLSPKVNTIECYGYTFDLDRQTRTNNPFPVHFNSMSSGNATNVFDMFGRRRGYRPESLSSDLFGGASRVWIVNHAGLSRAVVGNR